MKHYLYRHIRLDKNEPFYIGIGTKQFDNYKTFRAEYKRAFDKNRKVSKIWNSIVCKTTYEVEILLESDNYNFIKDKEKEFIKLYGRIDNKTGILANMTDGGDGTLGFIATESYKNKLINAKIRNIGKIYTGKKIYQYDLEGNFIKEWQSIKEAAISIHVSKSTLSKIVKLNKNSNYCKNYYWYIVKSDKIDNKKYLNRDRFPIIMLDSETGKEIKKFNKVLDAFKFLDKSKASGAIAKSIKNGKIAFGYKWKRGTYE